MSFLEMGKYVFSRNEESSLKCLVLLKNLVDKAWVVEPFLLPIISVANGEDLWRNLLNCERHTDKTKYVCSLAK